MSFKMASFLLPLLNGTDERHDRVHQAVKGALIRKFGGYHTYNVDGVYKTTNGVVVIDTCVKYEVTINVGHGGNGLQEVAYEIARKAGIAFNQESVLFQTTNGDVLFIPCVTVAAVGTHPIPRGWDVC